MTNSEFYKEEILEIANDFESFAVENNKIVSCGETNCSLCEFGPNTYSCFPKLIKWLYTEYEPPKPKPKLTKRERAFCEVVETGWIARDESKDLYWFKKNPIKRNTFWDTSAGFVRIDDIIYPAFDFIKWEDTEPYKVEDLLKLEVE